MPSCRSRPSSYVHCAFVHMRCGGRTRTRNRLLTLRTFVPVDPDDRFRPPIGLEIGAQPRDCIVECWRRFERRAHVGPSDWTYVGRRGLDAEAWERFGPTRPTTILKMLRA